MSSSSVGFRTVLLVHRYDSWSLVVRLVWVVKFNEHIYMTYFLFPSNRDEEIKVEIRKEDQDEQSKQDVFIICKRKFALFIHLSDLLNSWKHFLNNSSDFWSDANVLCVKLLLLMCNCDQKFAEAISQDL